MTLCNMVIEAGGKNGVIPPDSITHKYLEVRRTHHLSLSLSLSLMHVIANRVNFPPRFLFMLSVQLYFWLSHIFFAQDKTSLPYEPVYSDVEAR